jgi:hypothetical protein
VLTPSRWLLTVPLVLVAAALVFRRRRGLALFPIVYEVLAFLGLAVIYWIGTLPLDFWIITSAERIAVSLVLVPGVLLPLLLAEAVPDAQTALVSERAALEELRKRSPEAPLVP